MRQVVKYEDLPSRARPFKFPQSMIIAYLECGHHIVLPAYNRQVKRADCVVCEEDHGPGKGNRDRH